MINDSMIAYVVQDPQAFPFKLLRVKVITCELWVTNYNWPPSPFFFFLVFLFCSDVILQPLEGLERERLIFSENVL